MELKKYNTLVINPGSTSTKLAYYENDILIDETSVESNVTIDDNNTIFDQIDVRTSIVEEYIDKLKLEDKIEVIASRGPSGGNFKSGCYLINENILNHCYEFAKPHAATISPIIARNIADKYGIEAYIYDADGVNEFNEFASLSGHKLFPVYPSSHTLAQKSAAKKYCSDNNLNYNEVNLVVSHIGGGSSHAAHERGKLIDCTLDGYSPERLGGMPMLGLIEFTKECYSGKYTLNEMLSFQMGNGGLVSYLGTSDLREVENRISNGDQEASFYYEGMIYQQSKDIAMMSMAMEGKVDQIIFTGGVSYSELFTSKLKSKVEWIAPVSIYPGSFEMEALATGVSRALNGVEEIQEYSRVAR